MKPISLPRRLAALAVAVAVAVLVVGLAGQLPNFGEVAPVVFAGTLLGVWAVGNLAWRP